METGRRVMDAFLRQVLTNELTMKSNDGSVVEEKGQLKTTFLSRTDFDWKESEQGSIVVERLNNEKEPYNVSLHYFGMN